MKALLIARIPAYFEARRTDNDIFPPFQIQTLWLSALQSLGIKTHVFITSKSLLFPTRWVAKSEILFQKIAPTTYARFNKLKNIFFQWRLGNYLRSLQVLHMVKTRCIDTIIIAGGISELTGLELKIAHQNGVKIIMLHGEDPLISATRYERSVLPIIDEIFVNDPTHARNWKKLSARSVRALPYSGIDPNRYYDYGNKRVKDLVFVGTLLADRQETLESLIAFKPEIYGYIPPDIGLRESLKPFYRGEAWGEEMVQIYNQAKIVLNFSPPHMPIGGNLRLFEIPGCGSLQIANRCPRDWYQDGQSIVLYKDTTDLKAKIAYYLKNDHERKTIARRGYTSTQKHYTYQQRFKTMLSL